MSDSIGGSVQWLSGVAVGAAIVCWGVIPAVIGIGTQRSPVNGDLSKPGDVFQWLGANTSRVFADFGVTFADSYNKEQNSLSKDRVVGVLGAVGDRGQQPLPMSLGGGGNNTSYITSTKPKTNCVSSQDLNCDGQISVQEMQKGGN